MRHFALVFTASVLSAGGAAAATVSATGRIDASTPQVETDPVAATVVQFGVNGPLDFSVDEAFASADIRTGKLRFLARDGRQTGTRPINETSASATIEETLTLMPDAGRASQIFTIGLSFDASPAIFPGTFGVFAPELPLGGPHAVVSSATMRLTQRNLQPNGSVLSNSASALLQQAQMATIQRLPDGRHVVLGHNITERSEPNPPLTSDPLNPSQVVDVRTSVAASAGSVFSGLMEFDIFVSAPYTFDLFAQAGGRAFGGRGTYAATSSLNTASLFIDVPDGGSFTSGSGLFLTGSETTAPGQVPLPAPAVMLLSAAGLLAGWRRAAAGRLGGGGRAGVSAAG